MKKVALTLLALAILVGGAPISRAVEETPRPTSEQQLEKIPHPSHIKNYESIQRYGDSLWGKKKTSTDSVSRPGKSTEERSMKPSTTKETKKTEERQPVKIEAATASCVKTAIEAKDINLKTALTTHNTSTLTAIDARTTCQKEALDLTTASEQAKANAACIRAYHKAVGDSLKVLKTAKETGWKTFRSDLKVCKSMQPASQGDILVEDGEMQINLQVEKSE